MFSSAIGHVPYRTTSALRRVELAKLAIECRQRIVHDLEDLAKRMSLGQPHSQAEACQ